MKSDVEIAGNLFDWFDERVRDARAVVKAGLSDDGTLYLTALLAERARADRPAPPETTLVELHARGVNAPPAQQARTYRELGDRSLYLVGYFEESLQRGTVGPGYYCEMGSAAYARVDQVFKRFFANAFDDVFEELAARFRDCVRVLREVRRSVDDEPDLPMRLYRAWVETGDAAAAERLRSLGLILPARPSEA